MDDDILATALQAGRALKKHQCNDNGDSDVDASFSPASTLHHHW